MADMVIRDFYYIDTRVISSYFTQLPPKTRKRFRDEFVSTVDAVFKASLPPAVETARSNLEVPFDEAIAQLKYVEQHLKERGDIGTVDALNTRYIEGEFHVAYGLVPANNVRLFVAFPVEGYVARTKRHSRSYTILGDISMCRTRPTQLPVNVPDGSSLSRLVSVWSLINKPWFILKPDHPEAMISEGSPSDFYVRGVDVALLALHGLEGELSSTALQATFRGIVQLRARLVKDDTMHCVLYPIFLERL
jgi:hypothetical protein